MKAHSYYNASGKDQILKYIEKLSKDEKIDGYHVLQCMEQDRMDERVENNEISPSLKVICNMAYALGYDLKLVPRN